jgi:lon-related putative ATP-dependent protease
MYILETKICEDYMSISKLTVKDIRKEIPLEVLPFESTEEIPLLDTIIGQDRAIHAIEFGLEMESSGYNIYVSGKSGTGRTTIVRDIVQKLAKEKPTPCDWCYVNNFENQDAPKAIGLPTGKGKEFKEDVSRLIQTLREAFKKQFNSKEFEDQRLQLINQVNDLKREIIEKLNQEAAEKGLQVQATPTGFHTLVLKDGKPMKPEEYDELSDDQKKEVDEKIREIEIKVAETIRQLVKLDNKLRESLENLNKQVATFLVKQHLEALLLKYHEHKAIIQFLNDLQKDVIKNIHSFIDQDEDERKKAVEKEAFEKRYEINVIVDNSGTEGAPVIYEANPTYNNLFGRIEKKSFMGSYYTDFTMIKPGSLMKANGGYIILDALNVLRNPFVYDALKRALKTRELRLEDMSELYGFIASATIKPEPIPLNVKVILIGSRYIYSLLYNYDEDFTKIFKIRADFDQETNYDDINIFKYAQFVKRVTEEENLLPFHRTGIRELVYYGNRLVDDQEKLSLSFNKIVSVIREASFWARKDRKTLVFDDHVKKAVEEHKYRHNLIEEKIHEYITRDIIKINTSGECIGQINGLAVYHLGDYTFGKPHRITARTYIGSENIVDIERKARLGGKIHEKGVYILSGFFNSKFGEYIPLSFSATITFEQSYGMIDGDSASSAELFTLISSLADMPIKQNFAVTGSVNQMGEIQAIGGVNEKIEGFFHVCKSKGLTGDQGVIIPRSNIKNLVLTEEVLEAVQKGQFHIYAIDTVEDGIELLMGKKPGKRNKNGKFPRGSVYYRIEKKLISFAKRAREFREMINKSAKKEETLDQEKNNRNNKDDKGELGSKKDEG